MGYTLEPRAFRLAELVAELGAPTLDPDAMRFDPADAAAQQVRERWVELAVSVAQAVAGGLAAAPTAVAPPTAVAWPEAGYNGELLTAAARAEAVPDDAFDADGNGLEDDLLQDADALVAAVSRAAGTGQDLVGVYG